MLLPPNFFRFTRAKKSNIMAVDLNKDVFVIFASGPLGTVCQFKILLHVSGDDLQ